MQYEPNRPSGSSGGLVAALLLLLVLGGIGIVGLGTYVYVRSQAAARQAAAQELAALKAVGREMAALEQQRALEAQRREAAERDREQPARPDGAGQQPSSVDAVDVVQTEAAKVDATITVDNEGNLALHGRSVTHDELAAALRDLASQDGGHFAVTVSADEACPFRDVAVVVRKVREAGIDDVQLIVAASGESDATPN